jgi:hypothetical protein
MTQKQLKWHETPAWIAVAKRIGPWDSFLVHVLCKVKIDGREYGWSENSNPVAEHPASHDFQSWAQH